MKHPLRRPPSASRGSTSETRVRSRSLIYPQKAAGISWRRCSGEQEAVVLEVKPFVLHGVTYSDVTVQFPDRTVEQARLGPEGVPDDLQPGERVLATRVATMVISLRRP